MVQISFVAQRLYVVVINRDEAEAATLYAVFPEHFCSCLAHFYVTSAKKNCWKFHICSAIAAMNRYEAEAAHHAAFLDKQERVFHRRQQVICLCATFSFVVCSQLYVCIVNPATATKQMYNVGLGEVCVSWTNLPTGEMWL